MLKSNIKTLFKYVNVESDLIKKKDKALSKNKINNLLNEDLRKEFDFKMLMLSVHYKRLVIRNPDFAEFCEYTGFK